MISTPRTLVLNVNLQGYGQRPAAWQVQDLPADTLITEGYWHELVRIAERGRLDAVFFADHPALGNPNPRPLGLLDPVVLAASIAAASEYLGVIVSATTTYNDPVELADRLLGLDVVAGGRVGWNVVTTYNAAVSKNFGVESNPDRPTRYRRAGEFVDVVTALWASAASGDPVDHDGEFFRAHGVLATPPSPQGAPILFQAGGSAQGRELAASRADGVFSVELTRRGAIEHRRLVRDRAAALGRDPDGIRIVPGLSLVIGSTEREAQERFDDLEFRVPPAYTLSALGAVLGADASGLDLEHPIPAELLDRPWDPDAHAASSGYRETFLDWIQQRRGASVREVLRQFGGYGSRIVIGTPEQIADDIETWFRAGAADGFNIMLDRYPAGLAEFVDHVVPLVQARGIFRREYEAPTLRGRLLGTAAR